jgi:hypothetical protein
MDAKLLEAIEYAASLQPSCDIPNNDDPVDYEPTDKARISRARMKALVVLDDLMASDPDFAGIDLTTDKLFAYVKPPKEYYRAVVNLGIDLFELATVRDKSSAELKQWLQAKVNHLGYAVPKNCCNKPLFDWQLDEIAKATGIPFDRRRINSLSKIQAYADARAAGDDMWTPFNLSGFYSDAAVSFVEGCKPGKHKVFQNNGYPAFKRGGCKIALGTLKAIVEK